MQENNEKERAHSQCDKIQIEIEKRAGGKKKERKV